MPTDDKLVIEQYHPGLETGVVRVLNASHPQGWGTEAKWLWKHRDRPGFAPEEILAPRAGNEVVGCFHSGILPLVIDEGLDVLMCFDCDLAIQREFRGQGIPVAVRDLSERRLFAGHVALRGGFTSPELNERLYEKYFDFIFVPAVTTEYRKFLGPGPLRPRVEQLGEMLLARERVRRALARRPLVVDLLVDGLSDCHLVLSAEGFRLDPGLADRSHLSVRAPYALVASLADGVTALVKTLLAEFVRGRVRVRGIVRSGPRLAALLFSVLRGR